MSIDTSYCTTCGAYDTYACNGDNQCCTECGDTEGLVFEGEEGFPEQETKIHFKVKRYWDTYPDKTIAKGISTFEEAKGIADEANRTTDYSHYVFDTNGTKLT